jgi:excinuclease ABC subunit B
VVAVPERSGTVVFMSAASITPSSPHALPVHAEQSAFVVKAPYAPSGDQPAALDAIEQRFGAGERHVVLHGATGTGKSATTAWTIERLNRPTLVLAPNKVLAAQLASELRELLPDAAVCYFVSHFAYYRPEAYIASSDTYVEKESAVDDEIERLRHEATLALLTRHDVVVVASVSAIYGLGRPEEYRRRLCQLATGDTLDRDDLIRSLVDMGYQRNDVALERGRIRVRGDIVDVVAASGEHAYRVEFFGDTVEQLSVIDPLHAAVISSPGRLVIPPASHHVFDPALKQAVVDDIRAELAGRLTALEAAGKLLEAQRLRQRAEADLESIEHLGFCPGIENYSRHFDRRSAGEPPATLLDFFPDDYLTVIDESHVTVPQIAAMYEGDQSRKRTLVEHGFRLPSALDNRPLQAAEFWGKVGPVLYLSATPGPWEHAHAESTFVEQLIRPTGLVDPEVIVLPNAGRLEELLGRLRTVIAGNERALITTITKRQSEQLATWLLEQGIRAKYLHHDVSTVDRITTLRELRKGVIDVVVGVNLLREGLDLPEVALVAVLDADTEGFLRSTTSLIQTIGRAARNPNGKVVLYADRITPAMESAVAETSRRRALQVAHNLENGIVPTALAKQIRDVLTEVETSAATLEFDTVEELLAELRRQSGVVEAAMHDAAGQLRFEEAAALRDELGRLRSEIAELSGN